MPLKFKFKSREEIPAEHQGLYVERDGAWVLDVEGAVEKSRLDEFRHTNVALRREVESLNTRLADNSVESMVLQVASKFGVRAAALPDLTNRARQIFRMIDGELRPVQRDGKSPVLSADGANAISFEEWVTRQVAEAPHLFESSAGGGATGSGSGGAGYTGRNPFKREAEWNLTEQMKLTKRDPKLAARLKASAH